MKGFAMLEIGKVGWIEKDAPECGPLDAIVKPTVVSPCTSDVHTVWAGAIGPRSNMILGHEAVGEVVEVGSLVKDFKLGDRVVLPAITPDWGSLEAQDGFSVHSGGMLSGWKFSNFKDGVFAEYCHVNEADANMALIPEGVNSEDASMLCDMMPTGFHAVEMANVTFGDNVVVVGIGPVGLCAVAGAALAGAANIYVVGTRPNCIEIAKKYGATDAISYKEGGIAEQILEKTKGKGVDKVLIAGGDNTTMIDAIKMLKPGGIVGNVNYLGEGDYVQVPRVEWGCGMSHKYIHAGLMTGGRLRMEKLLRMVEVGRFDPSLLITHRFNKFEDIETALMLMKDKPRDLIKPVVSFG